MSFRALFEEDEREIREVLANLPKHAGEATDLPESFWRRQQIGVRAAIATQPAPFPFAALAWGTGLAVLMIAMLTGDAGRSSQSRNQEPIAANNISDQQLLMKVEYTLHNDVPVALEPAAMLAYEMAGGKNSYYSEGE